MTLIHRTLLRSSQWIEAFLRTIAHFFSWTLLVLVAVVCTEVITRKMGWRIPNLDSTRLQELAWHLQAVVFCSWIGYAYTRNAHVRVDVLACNYTPRTRRLIEVAGCLLLALPYILVALPYAQEFMLVAYRNNEASSSPGGLSHRWIIKGVLYLSFWGLLLANVAVLLRSLAQIISGDYDEDAGQGTHAHG